MTSFPFSKYVLYGVYKVNTKLIAQHVGKL